MMTFIKLDRLRDVKALQVPDLAAQNCHLYLWTTETFMSEAHDVARWWGFDVRNILTWEKPGMSNGHHFRGSTEFILFATRGNVRTRHRNVRTIFHWPRESDDHSRKPAGFFNMVMAQSPGPYCELFSRTQRAGWTCWGKESEGTRAKLAPSPPAGD